MPQQVNKLERDLVECLHEQRRGTPACKRVHSPTITPGQTILSIQLSAVAAQKI